MAIHSTPARAGRAPGEALAGVGWQTRSGDTGRPQRSILSPAFFWSCSRSSTCAGPCGPGDASVAEKPARVCSRHLTFGSAPLSTSHARDWTAMSPSPLVACANALNHTLADLRPSRTSRAVRANICVPCACRSCMWACGLCSFRGPYGVRASHRAATGQ